MKYEFGYYPRKLFIKVLRLVNLISQEKYRQRKLKYRKKFKKTVCINDKIALMPYKDYVDHVTSGNFNRKRDFVDITKDSFKRDENDTKVIAWYLPQFHQMDVNNKYHGQGFTEWTNVTRAIPAFVGHFQPQLPYDVGFYDLMNIDTFKRQIYLAKLYGIYGFCFHWYWFSGVRTMEKPLELYLNHKELDFPFCINWADENWSTLWDGGNKDLIFEQKLMDDDDSKFMNDILPYMKDRRYIKIDGRPVLSIYRCKGIFDQERFKKLLANFRSIAKSNGFPDLYIMITNAFDFYDDVADWGADAIVEFPPFGVSGVEKQLSGFFVNPYFKAHVYDTSLFIAERKYLYKHNSKKYFRSALVSFDNTARKGFDSNGSVFFSLNSETLQQWLKDIIEESKQIHSKSEDIVFVNSWNEWAEGSHLEPDMRFGYANLQAVKTALDYFKISKNGEYLFNQLKSINGNSVTFVVSCIESLGDIVACEPIARYLNKICDKSTIIWLVKDKFFDVVRFNPFISKIVSVTCLSEAENYCSRISSEKNTIIIDCHFNGRWCDKTKKQHLNPVNPGINERTYFDYGSILSSFSLISGLPALNDKPQYYLPREVSVPFDIPTNYIIFHCKSAESTKDWTNEKWNLLAKNLLSAGYTIVEVGLDNVVNFTSKTYIDSSKYKLSINQIALLISKSNLFVGIDSAFAHIANCFSITSVLIFGRYKNFLKPNPYSGNWINKDNVSILYAPNGELANKLDESLVEQECFRFLKIFNVKNND